MRDEPGVWLRDMFRSTDARQNDDLRRLKDEAAAARSSADDEKARLLHRIDRLELVCESLLHVILDKGLVSRAELGQMMARVDLRDGVEDNRARTGEPRSDTPTCPACDLPINPKRDACVYCDAPLPDEARGVRKVQRRPRCAGCGLPFRRDQLNLAEAGLLCDHCHTPGTPT
jgi:hypothetical protein